MPKDIGNWAQWAGVILSLVALAQPWLIKLYMRYLKSGTLDIYETARIEIGYNATWGINLGLHGTLRARDNDLFVRSVELEVIKDKDQSKHHFEWRLFRSSKVISGRSEETFELPTGFMLLTSQPYRYNILFADVLIETELRPILEQLIQAWREKVAEKGDEILDKTEQGEALATLEPEYQVYAREKYKEFHQTPAHANAFDKLHRTCYWEAGTYKIIMRVNTAHPDRTFNRTWKFVLSESDANLLRLNAIAILRQVCDQPGHNPYNQVFPGYVE